MKGGMGNLMRQAHKMQEDMQKAQEEVANLEVEGQAGGGMVKVVMTGRHEIRKVEIDEKRMTTIAARVAGQRGEPGALGPRVRSKCVQQRLHHIRRESDCAACLRDRRCAGSRRSRPASKCPVRTDRARPKP